MFFITTAILLMQSVNGAQYLYINLSFLLSASLMVLSDPLPIVVITHFASLYHHYKLVTLDLTL